MQKARMTTKRQEILKLIAKGYNNTMISKEMNLTLSSTKMQKWRLYCYLKVHTAQDAILAGKQINLLN